MDKFRMTKGMLLVGMILMTVVLLPNRFHTQAGGGGILVDAVEVCLNGVRFDTMLVDDIAKNHPMETLVHTLNPYSEVGYGANYEYSYIGETQIFTIAYPSSTFQAGDSVVIAVRTLDGALAGGSRQFTVDNCILPEFDGRLNHDLAAPVVIYQQETIDVYAIMPETSEGLLVASLSMESLEASDIEGISDGRSIITSTVNPATELPIIVYQLATGEIQVSTYYANGKAYIFQWHLSQPNDGTHVTW